MRPVSVSLKDDSTTLKALCKMFHGTNECATTILSVTLTSWDLDPIGIRVSKARVIVLVNSLLYVCRRQKYM